MGDEGHLGPVLYEGEPGSRKNAPLRGTDGAAHVRIVGPVTRDSFTQADLDEGVIIFGEGISYTGLDIYNDSEENPLTFTLKNLEDTVFNFTLTPGQSLKDQIYCLDFTQIEIEGTSPTFRAIVRS